MDTLIEKFIENLNIGDIWIGFLMLVIFYVLKKEPFKIFTYFSEQKTKDIDQARSLLESGRLGDESNELLREYLESYSFQKFYGISTSQKMRATLFKFYQKHQGKIGWNDLKRAYPYIKADGDSIKIELSYWSCLGRWAVTILSWFIGLYALAIIAIALLLLKSENELPFIALTLFSVVLLVAAMLFSSINWPFHSAVKIQKYTNKSQVNYCTPRRVWQSIMQKEK